MTILDPYEQLVIISVLEATCHLQFNRFHLSLAEVGVGRCTGVGTIHTGNAAGGWPGVQVQGCNLQVHRHHHSAAHTQRLTPVHQKRNIDTACLINVTKAQAEKQSPRLCFNRLMHSHSLCWDVRLCAWLHY